jgi:hypothetical protein
MFASAAVIAWRYNGYLQALLLSVWFPATYIFASIVSKRRRLIEQLSVSPLFLAVSKVVPYEGGFGWRREFQFKPQRADSFLNVGNKTPLYIPLASGQPFWSDQLFDQQLEFWSGSRESILELTPNSILELKEWCRKYQLACGYFDLTFIAMWLIATVVSISVTVESNIISLSILLAALAAGWISALTIPDRTYDVHFYTRQHYHIFTYYPGDSETSEQYRCLSCGTTKIFDSEAK